MDVVSCEQLRDMVSREEGTIRRISSGRDIGFHISAGQLDTLRIIHESKEIDIMSDR